MEFFEWLFKEAAGWAILWVIFAGGAIVIKKLKPYQATVSEYFPTFIKATLFVIFIIVAFNVLHKLNETLDATASKESTRPYFSQADAAIQSISKESHFLLIGLKSNDRTAENVVKQILLIEESLDPTIEPLLTERKELAGPIGPNSEFNLSVPFEIRKQNGTKLLFIVIQIQYTDALDKNTYVQPLLMKFYILLTENNSYIPKLEFATKNDEFRIESYIESRNIPMLE